MRRRPLEDVLTVPANKKIGCVADKIRELVEARDYRRQIVYF